MPFTSFGRAPAERVTGSRFFKCNSWREDPLFSGLRIGEFSEKRDLSVGEIWAPKSRFFIVRNKTLSGNGVQIVIGFFTQNWPQIHRNFDFFLIFSLKSILFTRRKEGRRRRRRGRRRRRKLKKRKDEAAGRKKKEEEEEEEEEEDEGEKEEQKGRRRANTTTNQII